MTAKQRSKPSKKATKKTSGKSNVDEPAKVFHEAVEAQIELWKKWSKGAGKDAEEAAHEVGPIVAKYWAKIFEAIWLSASDIQSHEDPVKRQEELRRFILVSYNDMMKQVLMTKSFAAKSGKSVKNMLEGTKAWNNVMEETLKALRMPTRGDIDELHESLYDLNKRVDELTKSLRAGGMRRSMK